MTTDQQQIVITTSLVGPLSFVLNRDRELVVAIRFGSTNSPPLASQSMVGGRVAALMAALERYADDPTSSLPTAALDTTKLTTFQRTVFAELAKLSPGETCAYGELARRLGAPQSARAVGGALRSNPFPVVIPCHRIIPAAGGVGNYLGGVAAKRALLAHEAGRRR